jgi:Tol biopolymer transport system component
VLYTSPQQLSPDFSWHPDGNRILFSMQTGRVPRLFTLNRANPGPPQLLPGQPLDHHILAADWSADGKQIVLVSQIVPDLHSVFEPVKEP